MSDADMQRKESGRQAGELVYSGPGQAEATSNFVSNVLPVHSGLGKVTTNTAKAASVASKNHYFLLLYWRGGERLGDAGDDASLHVRLFLLFGIDLLCAVELLVQATQGVEVVLVCTPILAGTDEHRFRDNICRKSDVND